MDFKINIPGKLKVFLLTGLFFSFLGVQAQIPSDTTLLNRARLNRTIAGTSVVYAGSLLALNQLWYADYKRSSFHSFNDNAQWQKMDKLGHVYSAYLGGMIGHELLRSAGLENKKASLYGGSLGFLFLSTVEVFDGFSQEWGFSWGDMLANGLGAGLFIGQELSFEKQVLQLKFSYQNTEFRKYRPEILGESQLEAIFKDYNGQRYWASINLNELSSSVKPRWLNLAFGYGAEGMINARGAYLTESNCLIKPYRQYFISLDLDWTKIKSKNEFTRILLKALNTIKIPAPSLEFREGGYSAFHFLFF